MSAVVIIARSRLRHRWRSVLVVGLLIAVAGGVVLTGFAGARRTRSALERLDHQTGVASSGILLFGGSDHRFAARVARLPGVEAMAETEVWAAGIVDHSQEETPIAAAVDDTFGTDIDRSILLHGRRARTAHEVVVPQNLAAHKGYAVGSRIRVATYSSDQFDALRSGQDVAPTGPTIPLRVVGIDRRVADLSTQGEKTGILFLGPAVYREYHDRVLAFAGLLRTRLTPGTEAVFASRFHAIARGRRATFDTGGLDTGGVADSLGVLAVGLLVFSILGAVGALATLVVLLTRWAATGRSDQPIEFALGQRARDRAFAVALPMLPAIVGGSLGAIAVAALGSRFMPIGAARAIEPHPGFDLDPLVLGVGIAVLLVATGGLTLLTAWSSTRRRGWAPAPRSLGTSVRVLAAVTRWRLPVPAVIGSRMALDRGRGPTAVPGRSAIVVAAVGITGVVAALVVGTSLHRLGAEPSRFAYGYDTIVEGSGGLTHGPDEPSCAPVRTKLSSMRAVAAIANYCQASVSIGGRSITATALSPIRGTIEPVMLRGHAPRGAREVALGEKTIARLGRNLGDHVTVRGQNRAVRARIVGTTFIPTPNSHDTVTLADGALLRADTLAKVDNGSFPQIVIRWRPGTDIERAQQQVRKVSGAPGIGPVRPPEIDRLLQVDDLPAILAAFLALLALVGLAHAVVTNASRRRRDLAILETLGFRTRQVAATIASHAVTLAIIGLAVGIPLGIVLGRLSWRAIADSVGIATDAALPWLLVAVAVPAVLLAVLTIAVFPARRVSRIRPAVALRSE